MTASSAMMRNTIASRNTSLRTPPTGQRTLIIPESLFARKKEAIPYAAGPVPMFVTALTSGAFAYQPSAMACARKALIHFGASSFTR